MAQQVHSNFATTTTTTPEQVDKPIKSSLTFLAKALIPTLDLKTASTKGAIVWGLLSVFIITTAIFITVSSLGTGLLPLALAYVACTIPMFSRASRNTLDSIIERKNHQPIKPLPQKNTKIGQWVHNILANHPNKSPGTLAYMLLKHLDNEKIRAPQHNEIIKGLYNYYSNNDAKKNEAINTYVSGLDLSERAKQTMLREVKNIV
ncbi:MAG: hypothetical protein P0S95_02540 [Rhabdochlamydiaceae bacterium]|nr:hypothetical protein [Candidatus Amphrikana amoebophyrae]